MVPKYEQTPTRSATLVLLRHGTSIANEGQSFGGWEDAALSERGVAQSRSAGDEQPIRLETT